MAANKEYGYYLRGSNQIAIVEKDIEGIDTSVNIQDINSWQRKTGAWKSPITTVADALEIEYTYAPLYTVDETDDINTTIDSYKSAEGKLVIADTAGAPDNFSASPESLVAGSHIVLGNAGRFNGLHKVSSVSTGVITLETLYSGSTTYAAFEEAVNLYYNVTVLDNEEYELDIDRYTANALVYYIKAKLAEDKGDFKTHEYMLSKWQKQVEKKQGAKVWGGRIVSSGYNAIK